MSNIEQIDFSTLIWVKKELDETLKRAQSAIEEYVENPEDENQLQFCATYLHQVQGTLKMVELYGAAMVAEEMEQVVKKILNKEVDSEKDSFEVLMRGIILLPDYLERIQLGYKDIPMVLLPLVNDLRTVKGDQLLSESALFNPDLSLGLPEAKINASFKLSHGQLIQVVKKIRAAYQICLLNWLKDVNIEENLKKLQIIVDKLKTVIEPTDEKQLFWVAGGLFEALINGGLEKSVTVKQLAARLDQAIRMLTSTDDSEEKPYKKLTNNLLYYVALSDGKERRIKEIQTFFKLSDFISDDKEIEHAQSSLSGKNRELLESVTGVIKEDLMSIQESLDLYNRNDKATSKDLQSIIDSLSKISDTLGIIGVGIARSKIREDIQILESRVNSEEKIDQQTIMHVAETLLFVGSSLDENILSLGEVNEVDDQKEQSLIPSSEMKGIMDTLAKESIQNLQKIKQNFVLFIESPWNKESIESSPKLLKEISGALKMSGLDKVADEIDRVEEYTSKYMLHEEYKPSVDELDLLAEAIASLEYYLEYLSDGVKGEERILTLAQTNIATLFDSIKTEDNLKQPINDLDADLDKLSDEDFDIDDDFDIDGEFDELSLEDSEFQPVVNEINEDVSEEKSEETPELIVSFSDETDDDIKEVFLEEFEEELEHLNSIFPRWENNPDDQMELLGEIRRIYHTLKGSGRLVGALAIGDYSWKIEDMTNLVLNKSNKLNDSFIMVMKKSSELLPGLLDALKNTTAVPEGYYEILAATEKVIDGKTVTIEDFEPKKVVIIEAKEIKIESEGSETKTDKADEILDLEASETDEINHQTAEDTSEQINTEDEVNDPVEDSVDVVDAKEEELEVESEEITETAEEEFVSEVEEMVDDFINFDNSEEITPEFVENNGTEVVAETEQIETEKTVDETQTIEIEPEEQQVLLDQQIDLTDSNSEDVSFEIEFDIDDAAIEKVTKINEPESNDLISDVTDEIDNTGENNLDIETTTSEAVEEDVTEEDEEVNEAEEDKGLKETVEAEEIDAAEDLEEVEKIKQEDDAEKESNDVIDDLSVDPVFVEILQQEVEGHLNDIASFVASIEESGNAASTEHFIRVVHTLNGAANMASVNSIVEMTTPLETVAKLSHELNIDLDEDCIANISKFKDEASSIMTDLAQKSNPNTITNEISEFFKANIEKLDKAKAMANVIEDPSMDFDLSQFIDEEITDNINEGFGSSESDTAEQISEDTESSEEINDAESAENQYDKTIEEGEIGENELDLSDLESEINTSDSEENLQDSEELDLDELDFDDSSEENAEDELELKEYSIADIRVQEEVATTTEDSLSSQTEENNTSSDVDEIEFQDTVSDDDNETIEETKEDASEIEESLDDLLDLSDLDFDEKETDETELQQVDLESKEETDSELNEEQNEQLKQERLSRLEDDHISATISTSYKEEGHQAEESYEFDEELLEIFKEEADDILDRTEHVLSDLESNPDDASLILSLQRDLHTLKGGARMAGLENIGELGHVLESLLEIIGEESRTVDSQTLSAIHESFDLLNKMKEEKDYGQSVDISSTLNTLKHLVGLEDDAIPEESKFDLDYMAPIDAQEDVEVEQNQDPDHDIEVLSVKKKSNVLSGNQIKVNSELLDNLVNYAGEVSIYRSRLEQEVGSFRVNLSELGNTVARIREQLRKLDAETEAQIISTFQTEEDEDGFDPLEMDRFSQLQQLSRSLTESVSDLTSIHSYLDDVARTSDNLLTQQSRVNTELQEGLMETRLVSFNSIVPRLRRLVRTTSNELNKPVRLEVNGAEGEMDKTVLEGVIAPLEHMLRNSLAHGIEKDRSQFNKSEQGAIAIDVRREATEVVISVIDDGAGINRQKVKQLAIEKGIINKNATISDENIDRLILHSGFTTVDEVSKLAGRGVGMDVVSNQINLLGGSLDISSNPGKGTKFSIRLPYTLALSSALLVEVDETVYAIPVSGLEGIIRMSYSDYTQKVKDNDLTYQYANEDYQLHELNKLLDIESEVIVENNQIPLVMIRSGDNGVALRVDRIIGSREVVVKTVGSQISSVPGIYGATILGDGNVVLILDIIPLSRAYLKKLDNMDEMAQMAQHTEIEKDPLVMIVDDSITMRKVGERILRRNEYDVVTAKDGIDALDQLKEAIPDVMLLDIEMPRMDGYELAIEMKKEDKYANIPIIMITSRTGEKHRQKAMDLGVDRYLGKPYQEADLLENIRDLIETDED